MSLSGLINISKSIQRTILGSTSTFVDKKTPTSNSSNTFTAKDLPDSIGVSILAFIIFILILYVLLYLIMLIGSYLFNNSISIIFSTKKITVFEFFCLYIVINMLFSCNCNTTIHTNDANTGKSNFVDIENKNILLLSFGAVISVLFVAITLIFFKKL